jgi:hypothetical protein
MQQRHRSQSHHAAEGTQEARSRRGCSVCSPCQNTGPVGDAFLLTPHFVEHDTVCITLSHNHYIVVAKRHIYIHYTHGCRIERRRDVTMVSPSRHRRLHRYGADIPQRQRCPRIDAAATTATATVDVIKHSPSDGRR